MSPSSLLKMTTVIKKLTMIVLSNTRVMGDIVKFNSLRRLTHIIVPNSCVSGDIAKLKSLPKLTIMFVGKTDITGDVIEFNLYRQKNNLVYCEVYPITNRFL